MSNRGNCLEYIRKTFPTSLYQLSSLAKDMKINYFSGLYIMAVAAVFVTTITATSVMPAAVAQNMTAGGANMTDMNQTGSISQVVPQDEQEQETGDIDITGGEGGQQGGSGSDQGGDTGSDDYEFKEN